MTQVIYGPALVEHENRLAIARRAASALVHVDFSGRYRPLEECMDCCHAYGLSVRDALLADVIGKANGEPDGWARVRDNLSELTYSADYLNRIGGLSNPAMAQVWAVAALLTYVNPLEEDMLRVSDAVRSALWHDKQCALAGLVAMLRAAKMPRETVAEIVVSAVRDAEGTDR